MPCSILNKGSTKQNSTGHPLNCTSLINWVGSKRFVEHVNSALGALAKGGKPRQGEEVISLESLQRPMETILGSKTKI
jgi:hypothetical protein